MPPSDPSAPEPAVSQPPAESLDSWLCRIEALHPRSIDLGLERVREVREALGLAPGFPIITVGGTNGKGSACAMLEAILRRAGYRVGCYTSPHLLHYNERVRVDGRAVDDAALISAFEAVDHARGAIPLTYFEFSTLAAMWLYAQLQIEVAILEVGLGGRLDAVNAFDADCAMVMSVDLDHMEYLGDTREAIGYEKAGIFRSGRPAICADAAPPQTLLAHAEHIGARLLVIGRDFGYETAPAQWRFWGPRGARPGLPHPALRGEYQIANAAACIAALDTLRERLPVSGADVRAGLVEVENPARFQVLPGRPVVILDVAHNPAAARALADNLSRMKGIGRTYAVFSMLTDKDAAEVARIVAPHVDDWLVAGIDAARGRTADEMQEELARSGVIEGISKHPSIVDAYAQASEKAAENDRIVVFGSFHTVAAVMAVRGMRAV